MNGVQRRTGGAPFGKWPAELLTMPSATGTGNHDKGDHEKVSAQFGGYVAMQVDRASTGFASASESSMDPPDCGTESGNMPAAGRKRTEMMTDPEERLSVPSQIVLLSETATALKDDCLSFTLARDFDLREIGLLKERSLLGSNA